MRSTAPIACPPEDEEHWLEAAGSLSCQALAREVRAVDGRALENGGGDPPPDEDNRETVQLRCAWGVKGKWFHARQLARRVAGESLPPWKCAEYMAAEVLSALGLEVEVEGAEDAEAEARAEPAVSASVELPEAPALAHPGGEEPGVCCGEPIAGCAAAAPRSADAIPSFASLPSAAAFGEAWRAGRRAGCASRWVCAPANPRS